MFSVVISMQRFYLLAFLNQKLHVTRLGVLRMRVVRRVYAVKLELESQ